jgi:hypothetical protein
MNIAMQILFQMTGALWQAAARHMWRQFVWQYARWAVVLLLLAFFVFPRVAGPRGFLAAMLLAGFCGAALWFGYHKFVMQARVKAVEMKPVSVVYRAADDGLHVPISSGEAVYEWKRFRTLARFPDVWLLYYAKMGALFVPAEAVAGDVGEFLVAKVREAGGTVT